MTDVSKLARELINVVRVVGSQHIVPRREYYSLDLSNPTDLDPTWTVGVAKLVVSLGSIDDQSTLGAWITRLIPRTDRPNEVMTHHVLHVAHDGSTRIYDEKLFTALTKCLVPTGRE